MTDETRVTVGDGKYTIVHRNGRSLRALRYGEEWRGLPGDDLVSALVQEIEALKASVSTAAHQRNCHEWLRLAFPDSSHPTLGTVGRLARFMEEAIELAQALGWPPEKVREMVEHVYSRPVGMPKQEVAGAFNTLCMLATALAVDAGFAGSHELARAYHRIDAIRAKTAALSESATC